MELKSSDEKSNSGGNPPLEDGSMEPGLSAHSSTATTTSLPAGIVSLGEALNQTSPDSIALQDQRDETGQGEDFEVWHKRNRALFWGIFWNECGIPPRHRQSIGKKLDPRGGAIQPVADSVVCFCRRDRLEGGLYLCGPVGCGKTLIASKGLHLIASDVCKRTEFADVSWDPERETPRFRLVSVPRLLADTRATFDGNRSSASVVDEFRFADVLVLDDIGAEKPSEWVRDTLFQIVDWRYGRNSPTIFTSNCSLRELAERLSERIADRILEMCQGNIIEIKCGSYRGMTQA